MGKRPFTIDEHLDTQQYCALFTASTIFEM